MFDRKGSDQDGYSLIMKTNLSSLTLKTSALILLTTSLTLGACGNSSASKPEGKLKNTEYCKRYKEFEEKVPVVKPAEQLELLEKIVQAKDFPKDPSSLKEDYEFIIEGYNKIENDTYDINQQDKYREASERTQRHAIENCEVLVSNSGT